MKRLSVLLSILFITTIAYCADSQRNLTYEIKDFSKGLNTKLSNFSLPSNQATVAENVRFNSKLHSLSKRSNLNVYGTADATEPITSLFRHYLANGDKILLVTHGDEIETGADSTGAFTNILNLTTGGYKWQWTTWHNIAIGTDGYNQPVKYDGSSASATYLGAPLATLATSGSGPATGNYTYKCSCYSASYNVILNVPSNTITADGNDVTLTMIPICPDTLYGGEATTGRKVYRTESNGSTYKLLSNGTISDNTTVTLTDSDADAALGAAYPAGDATWTPPKGKFLLVQNNRLFIAHHPDYPSRVYYSSAGSHEIFDISSETGYLDIRQNDGDTITFIKGNLGLLTIGKNNTIQKIYIDGADPDADWSISDPLSYVGCQAPYTAVNSPLGIIYLAKDGIYRFTGQYSELLSESVTPQIQDISPTDISNAYGIYHDNLYHLAYTSEQSAEHVNNRVLVLDILSKAYSIDLLKINSFTSFNSGNDWGILYAGAADSGKVYAYSSDVNEVIHKRHSDFMGLWDDSRYIPTGLPGGVSEDPIIEIARTETINQLPGTPTTINTMPGVIDRQDYIGHYVSQPLNIGTSTFDKLYWNEVLPSGCDVTFQLRTSPTGENNLLLNDDFEFWDNSPYSESPSTTHPNDWIYYQYGSGGGASSDTTVVLRGDYSCKLTKPSAGTSMIYNSIDSTNYRNKNMVFEGWMKSANSTADAVYFQVYDGTTTRTYHYHNAGGWENASTTMTVSATSTYLTTKCIIDSTADAVAYFDKVMMIEGTSAVNDWSTWSTTVTNPIGSDVSGITSNTYVQYLMNLYTNDLTLTPTIVNENGYNVRLIYSKEGSAQTTDIPLRYETGWIDFGAPTNHKIIRGIETYHSGTEGILTITLTNFDGDTEEFDIDIPTYTNHYKEYTTGGAFRGRLFKVTISHPTGVLPFVLDKLIIKYDVEPEIGNA